ncbi:hypothetical protein BiPBO1_65 [Brucella phage BiPBO1]|uniref:hypothetical protein n=1 Tax=Brucella phage BiPBO1 TaxID=1718278 RepID=UPI00046D7B07|nr:hypothetical protein [Brucella inopinata]YP_009304093.1 hypothetical protein BJD47_gp65 [Brucella phage BiPBO1]ALJ98279.1 hypothetical protein BiPBO1_65 [Brucella phage BiPBO1]KEY04126.1 hypothetical protein IL59_0212015 [Brucella suis bv. 4 str. 40]
MIDENLPPLPEAKDPKKWRDAKVRNTKVDLTAHDIDQIISIFSTTHHAFLELYAAVTGAGGSSAEKRQEFAKQAFGSMHQSSAMVTEFLNSFIERADNGEFDGQ